MLLKRLLFLFLIFNLAACVTNKENLQQTAMLQHSGTGALLISPIVFAEKSYIRDAVKNECRLPEKLTGFIKQYAAGQYADIGSGGGPKSGDAQILTIEIIDVMGSRGGAWSGGKMVMIEGKLTQNGRLLGNFKGRRVSGGGVFGAYKGTCAILGRCVKALGKDIAAWLTAPSEGAVLGDM